MNLRMLFALLPWGHDYSECQSSGSRGTCDPAVVAAGTPRPAAQPLAVGRLCWAGFGLYVGDLARANGDPNSRCLIVARVAALCLVGLWVGALRAQPVTQGLIAHARPVPETPRPDCHRHAAQYHGVNAEVLRAILWNESRMNPQAINASNGNGSIDVGIGQHNSMHFRSLASVGVTPRMLLDPCVGIYVAAWHLSKAMRDHGNTWFGIGAYHSRTPLFNNAYANAIAATLAEWGQLPKGFVPFPNAPRNTAAALRQSSSAKEPGRSRVGGAESMVALDG